MNRKQKELAATVTIILSALLAVVSFILFAFAIIGEDSILGQLGMLFSIGSFVTFMVWGIGFHS